MAVGPKQAETPPKKPRPPSHAGEAAVAAPAESRRPPPCLLSAALSSPALPLPPPSRPSDLMPNPPPLQASFVPLPVPNPPPIRPAAGRSPTISADSTMAGHPQLPSSAARAPLHLRSAMAATSEPPAISIPFLCPPETHRPKLLPSAAHAGRPHQTAIRSYCQRSRRLPSLSAGPHRRLLASPPMPGTHLPPLRFIFANRAMGSTFKQSDHPSATTAGLRSSLGCCSLLPRTRCHRRPSSSSISSLLPSFSARASQIATARPPFLLPSSPMVGRLLPGVMGALHGWNACVR